LQEYRAVRSFPIHLGLLACAFAVVAPLARSAGCTVSTSGLNFGNYDVFSPLNDDITATINVNCASDTPYSIWLSSGSGTFSSRTLTNGSHLLAYNLYLDPTRLTIWGDGSSGSGTVSGTGTGSNLATSIYGRIPAGQNAWMGPYTDLVTITVNF
jgi:spore coat protein U-like protein